MRNPISDKIQTIQPSGIRKFFDIVSEMKVYVLYLRVKLTTQVIRDLKNYELQLTNFLIENMALNMTRRMRL